MTYVSLRVCVAKSEMMHILFSSVPTTSIVKRTGPRVPENTYEHRTQDNTIYEELSDTVSIKSMHAYSKKLLRQQTEDIIVHSCH